ncbi:MAG: response regulator transcription factor [Prevotella sp.]|nr:response regulator transcription factor [Prevotella sp.]
MIRTIAIDDEPLALQQLVTYIRKVPFLELVAECQSAIDAQKVLEQEVIDVMFIDINMPDLNGLDFVRTLAAPPLVVFTTAYSEYALEGYKVNAVDYLLKPFGMDEFMRAANKVKQQYDLTHTAEVSRVDDNDAIFLKTEHRIVRINVTNIRYIEGMSEYLKIYLKEGKPLVVLLSMKKMEERLSSTNFMRIHRSYIINLNEIQEVNKNRVILYQDTYLPIGDLYRDQLNRYIESKFLGK